MNLREDLPRLDGATAWLNKEDGKEVIDSGKPTLVHFWSVSCHSCKLDIPKVNRLFETFKDDINVISVHMPRTESDFDSDKVREVAEQFKIKQPIYVDHHFFLTDAFENQYVPAYYIFDSDQKLRHFQAGGDGMTLLINRLERIIRKGKK